MSDLRVLLRRSREFTARNSSIYTGKLDVPCVLKFQGSLFFSCSRPDLGHESAGDQFLSMLPPNSTPRAFCLGMYHICQDTKKCPNMLPRMWHFDSLSRRRAILLQGKTRGTSSLTVKHLSLQILHRRGKVTENPEDSIIPVPRSLMSLHDQECHTRDAPGVLRLPPIPRSIPDHSARTVPSSNERASSTSKPTSCSHSADTDDTITTHFVLTLFA